MTEVLEKVFKTVPHEPSSPTSNTLFQMPRSHANELAIAAAILPVASSNLLAQVSSTVFAPDASKEKGASCSCDVKEEVSRAIWLSGVSKATDRFCRAGPGLSSESLRQLRKRIGKRSRGGLQRRGCKEGEEAPLWRDP